MKIPDEEACQHYGVYTDHEKMDTNDELRFRLKSPEGNGYIRTIASPQGGWQKSHYHEQLIETYIVEKRWIVLAEWRGDSLVLKRYSAGQCFSTEPEIRHNIYMPTDAVISTVKHGSSFDKDWHGALALDQMTTHLSEEELLKKALIPENRLADKPEAQFAAYMSLYNNLDSMLWKIPAFAIAIMSLFVSVYALLKQRISPVAESAASNGSFRTPAPATTVAHDLFLAIMIFVPGILLLLAAWSMHTIRFHHTKLGVRLAAIENDGYFRDRAQFLRTRIPAPLLIQFFVVFLGVVLLIFAVANLYANLFPSGAISNWLR